MSRTRKRKLLIAVITFYDPGFARHQIEVFRADLARSRRYTLEQWNARPLRERLLERAASLLASQL